MDRVVIAAVPRVGVEEVYHSVVESAGSLACWSTALSSISMVVPVSHREAAVGVALGALASVAHWALPGREVAALAHRERLFSPRQYCGLVNNGHQGIVRRLGRGRRHQDAPTSKHSSISRSALIVLGADPWRNLRPNQPADIGAVACVERLPSPQSAWVLRWWRALSTSAESHTSHLSSSLARSERNDMECVDDGAP
jgi:hypothetical protein